MIDVGLFCRRRSSVVGRRYAAAFRARAGESAADRRARPAAGSAGQAPGRGPADRPHRRARAPRSAGWHRSARAALRAARTRSAHPADRPALRSPGSSAAVPGCPPARAENRARRSVDCPASARAASWTLSAHPSVRASSSASPASSSVTSWAARTWRASSADRCRSRCDSSSRCPSARSRGSGANVGARRDATTMWSVGGAARTI